MINQFGIPEAVAKAFVNYWAAASILDAQGEDMNMAEHGFYTQEMVNAEYTVNAHGFEIIDVNGEFELTVAA